MKRLTKAGTMSIAAAIAGCVAGGAEAQSASFVYSVRTPVVSVTAGAQLGNSNNSVVHQNSAINVYAVTQIGSNDSAKAVQSGKINSANIVQVAPGAPTLFLPVFETGAGARARHL